MIVSSFKKTCNNKPTYGYMLPNLTPSLNLYKVQSVYNNNEQANYQLSIYYMCVCAGGVQFAIESSAGPETSADEDSIRPGQYVCTMHTCTLYYSNEVYNFGFNS